MNGPADRRRVSLAVTPLAVALGLSLLAVSSGHAQAPAPAGSGGAAPERGATAPGVEVVAPTPARPAPEFGFERGSPPPDRPREGDFYPERTRSTHDPAFVSGAATTVRTSRASGVRFGLSGWTAPRVPFDFRESGGGPAIGLSFVWGVPLPPEAEPAPAPAANPGR
jgi:hypothetical protein